MYTQLGKTLAKIPLQRHDCILTILKKCVFKETIGRRQKRSKILSIPNTYKNTLKDLVDSSDIKYLPILRQIDLSSNNILNSKNNLIDPK